MGKRGRWDFGRSFAGILRDRIASSGINFEEVVDVDALIANLRSSNRDYARLKAQPFARAVRRTLASLSCKPAAAAAAREDNDIEDAGIDPASPGISRSALGRGDSVDSRLLRSETDETVSDAQVEPEFDLMKSMLRDGYGKKSNSSKKDELESSCEEELDLEVEMEKPRKMRKVQKAIGRSGPGNEAEISIEKENTGGGGILDCVMEQGPRFCDLGGMKEIIEEMKLKVLYPLLVPELVQNLGIKPITGILLHGPPGCGKSTLAYAIANEAKLPFHKIDATQIVSGITGASEENIRDLFCKARRTAPSIILIEEIDAIASKRENEQKGMERRIVNQLMTCMDQSRKFHKTHNTNSKSETFDWKSDYVLVIGTTNNPDDLDSALRRTGRFDREIALGVPDENARLAILSILTHNLYLDGQLNLSEIARRTSGFVGSDLVSLCNEAGFIAINHNVDGRKVQLSLEGKSIDDWCEERPDVEEINSVKIRMSDFKESLKIVQPSSMREGFSPIPNITWDDVGGLSSLKKIFEKIIIDRIKYPEVYKKNGVKFEDGILLYGPPGCGKTLIVKAVANVVGVNFIYIEGPELLNKYVGESERKIRKVFRRAQACSPCIVFFDEIDVLARKRKGENSRVVEQQLAQLLLELDGAKERKDVFVIAATNRPEAVDPALLRPRRLGKVVYVSLPSFDERLLILKALAREMPISEDVDLVALAEECSNFSGADLASLMSEAATALSTEEIDCIKQGIEITQQSGIKPLHFRQVLQTIKPSVSEKERKYYERLSKNFKIR
ncbi:cell division control protein 48 homolog C-like isoform X2 [Zingiber officinale]|uniref:cell division control protein 48 homolog C-like isoform X2 n=1 Tax=Zingiber officinale TaxID=94328 RepID=UPI001C4CBBCA|nr:cell division control protein 48 homolog C-like isoform X2 [Zingiber officinale]